MFLMLDGEEICMLSETFFKGSTVLNADTVLEIMVLNFWRCV